MKKKLEKEAVRISIKSSLLAFMVRDLKKIVEKPISRMIELNRKYETKQKLREKVYKMLFFLEIYVVILD